MAARRGLPAQGPQAPPPPPAQPPPSPAAAGALWCPVLSGGAEAPSAPPRLSPPSPPPSLPCSPRTPLSARSQPPAWAGEVRLDICKEPLGGTLPVAELTPRIPPPPALAPPLGASPPGAQKRHHEEPDGDAAGGSAAAEREGEDTAEFPSGARLAADRTPVAQRVSVESKASVSERSLAPRTTDHLKEYGPDEIIEGYLLGTFKESFSKVLTREFSKTTQKVKRRFAEGPPCKRSADQHASGATLPKDAVREDDLDKLLQKALRTRAMRKCSGARHGAASAAENSEQQRGKITQYLISVSFQRCGPETLGIRDARELRAISECLDALLGGDVPRLEDALARRFKALEAAVSDWLDAGGSFPAPTRGWPAGAGEPVDLRRLAGPASQSRALALEEMEEAYIYNVDRRADATWGFGSWLGRGLWKDIPCDAIARVGWQPVLNGAFGAAKRRVSAASHVPMLGDIEPLPMGGEHRVAVVEDGELLARSSGDIE
ncbi:unnamed protein product [Prorocentrum cordatum]|uniref:Uncharacterized protein n=1 Tax=Prorocentrum cordatum TaxID=2364126 RepID=A0ABN9UZ84_9DINO|nr:unnamed protein product [Polarella glacialis]